MIVTTICCGLTAMAGGVIFAAGIIFGMRLAPEQKKKYDEKREVGCSVNETQAAKEYRNFLSYNGDEQEDVL